jgi:hypothetical protein
MKARAVPDAVKGRPHCLALTSTDAEDDEEEHGEQKANGGFGSGLLRGVTERVTNVGTGLARVSSLGRAGKTFATYLFDAESP